jgi:hypothetical protein
MATRTPRDSKPVGLVACGALAREVLALIEINRFSHIETRFLASGLHNKPNEIPAAVDAALEEIAPHCSRLYVGYADCGTAGALDKVLHKHGATRIGGAHCYAFYLGLETFDGLQEDEPGTLYLTDFLARQFDTLIFEPLGLDRHPELRDAYFGNYTRVMHLAQTSDAGLDAKARNAAGRLGLRYERRDTGYGMLADLVAEAAQ